MTEFEIFALDHLRHNHCKGCGGCLLDPSHVVQSYPAWCVSCVDRIKSTAPKGAPLPWSNGGWEFRPEDRGQLAAASLFLENKEPKA